MTARRLGFRPLLQADLPMVLRWLADPGVAQWYPESENNLIENMRDARVRNWIVSEDGRPVAHLQDYEVHGWEGHPLKALPVGSRGIDLFLGDAADRGRGLGSRMVRQHGFWMLAEGAPAIGIDPHPDHAVAIAAYRRAGFVPYDEVVSEWGPACVMALRPEQPG